MSEYEMTERTWVLLSDIFGLPKIPAEVASVVRRAVDLMVRDDLVSVNAKWQALEAMAANILNTDRTAIALGQRTRQLVDEVVAGREPKPLAIITKSGAKVYVLAYARPPSTGTSPMVS